MTTRKIPTIHHITNEIIQFCKKNISKEEVSLLRRFLKLYLMHIDPADFIDRSVDDTYGMVISHWQLMQTRKPDELKIRVFNPTRKKDGWESAHTIVEVVSADMPFLVDSMRMEVNRLGRSIHMMIYTGGVKVVRDANNNIKGVYSYGRQLNNSCIEAPIYMEIDRQTDPKVLKSIEDNLRRVISDVHTSVLDWPMMQERMRESIAEIESIKLPQHEDEIKESKIFLEWLLANHFTFLGVRDYEISGTGAERALKLTPGSGLGVLRNETHSKMYRLIADLPEKAREHMLSKESLLVISKTNTPSTVHRRAYTDYIGVKRFNSKGELVGERRFIGLYTSAAYSSNPAAIPFLRDKVASVMKRSGLPVRSHAGKDLMYILETFPRDDLFQASTNELYHLAMGILHMQERRRIRVFIRKDAYGRYFSCLVYIPRRNFNTQLLEKMQQILIEELHGLEAKFTTHFSASVLARIDYIVRVEPRKRVKFNVEAIEERLAKVGKSWFDGFREAAIEQLGEEEGIALSEKYQHSFPAGYRENFDAATAVHDVEHLEKVTARRPLQMHLFKPANTASNAVRFKLYCYGSTAPLSDALPMLENMGLRVIGEQPYKICMENGESIWINDFNMTYVKAGAFVLTDVKEIFQDTFLHLWRGDAESDAFNRLVLEAQLDWREISLLRAYGKYMRQAGVTFSLAYIAETFINNAKMARLLIELFHEYFDPDTPMRPEVVKKLEEQFVAQLDEVSSLDEDRTLRRYLSLIQATLRTNYYQKNKKGFAKKYIALKFDPTQIPELPKPLPQFEVFVYSPRFEGAHLRSGKVARGGIRWSDRREDFRTEVLGLMKAQQVKNAVIVPGGAKGGFISKRLPLSGTREEIIEEGVACYRGFINGLLDLTDNLKNGRVIKPKRVVCYDEDDPYLVVAADKGTATFSDIANNIAVEKGYWLGDAFASGGSTGYDHKKMGITARGAWVSAQRQFQELGINVDEAEISVIGVGDMSGDVFGNGMLLSNKLRLLAAFNHMHIFVDPNPDPQLSYEERVRLFNTPRSTWDDYDRNILSKGGNVFRRTAKSIRINAEMKETFNIQKDSLTPNELIRAILTASVDMLWNGGIGTYVKSDSETNNDVEDRANDSIRVNASEIRARVICEGGNLGLTQLGRIEFELNGGKINTDFLDNSAGVDCSDHEVNIKILLNGVVAKKELSEKQRNNLLSKMTNEVARLVLNNNYHQNEAISMASFLSADCMNLYIRYINWLEKEGRLDRALEFLPNNQTLLERKAEGRGLTKPELCVLMAYSKNVLREDIDETDLPDDPYLTEWVRYAFPKVLHKRYADQMQKHGLRRDIVATQLSNHIVSDMGITFAYQMYDETGASLVDIVRAYVAASEIFHMAELHANIEALDYRVSAETQHAMTNELVKLVRRSTRWFLRNQNIVSIDKAIKTFKPYVDGLFRRLPKLLVGKNGTLLQERATELTEQGVSPELAHKISAVTPLYHCLNIIEVAAAGRDRDVYQVAKIYFVLVDRLDLFWFRNQINDYVSDSHWSILAKAAYKGDLDLIQRQLALSVLNEETTAKTIPARINAWFDVHADMIDRWQSIVTKIRSSDNKDFSMLSVAIRELSDVARMM